MFGDNLKELRILSNLTQQDLAKRLNLSQETISFYESGKREPDYTTLKKIANFFDVSIDYLFGRTDNKVFHTTSSVKDNNTSDKLFDGKQEDLKSLITFVKNLTPEQIKSINNLIEAFNSKK